MTYRLDIWLSLPGISQLTHLKTMPSGFVQPCETMTAAVFYACDVTIVLSVAVVNHTQIRRLVP